MSEIVSDNLIDAINDDALRELENEVVIEKIEVPIINNADTIKKIEESRHFITADSIAIKSNDLKPNKESVFQDRQHSTYETSRSSYSSNVSHGLGYNNSYSNYRYGQEKETIESKASKVVSESVKRIKERVDKKFEDGKKLRTNWNTLQLMDEERVNEINKRAKPKKKLTQKQAKRKLFFKELGVIAMRAAMEAMYIIYHEKK
jgi:hypothetical protein